MKTILVTVAKNPTLDYPFAVSIDDGQEDLCRSLRDCLLVANGMQAGLMHVRVRCNIVWDPRLRRED